MELTVKLEGKVLEGLKKASAESRRMIQKGIEDSSEILFNKAVTEAPASTGILAKSIRREISELRATIFPTVGYAYQLHGPEGEERSAPFTIPAKEAKPGGTLYRWATKKGLNPWPIRKSIAKKGIKHQPWLRRVSEENEGNVEKIFVKVIDGIANQVTK
jgi:hypothetical protein